MNQKGVAHYLVLLLIVVGIGVGLYLVQNPQVFSPKAQSVPGFERFTLRKPAVACTLIGGPNANQPRVVLTWTKADHPARETVANPTYTIMFREGPGAGATSGRETRAGTTRNTTFELTSANGLVKGRSYGFIITAPGIRGGTVFSDDAWSDKTHGYTPFICQDDPAPSPSPSVKPSSSPSTRPELKPPAFKTSVTHLEKATRTPQGGTQIESFYTNKSNEILYLSQRGWANKGEVFKSVSPTEPDAVMAKRITYQNGGIVTWAADPAELAKYKSLYYKESADSDFYVFLTQKPGTVAVNRLKDKPGDEAVSWTFALTKTIPGGWYLDKANVFYVYP